MVLSNSASMAAKPASSNTAPPATPRASALARKPSREEFTMIAKVSMAGIGLIGFMGFMIYALLTELPKLF